MDSIVEKPLLIIDGHLDMGFNALFNQRDLTQSIQVLREREDSLKNKLGPYETDPGTVTVSLPELRRGCVGIMLATIMVRVQVPWPGRPNCHNAVRTQPTAYARGQSHLAYYQALEKEGEVSWIKTLEDLDSSVAAWENPTPDTPVGLILSMESADPILGPDQVAQWWEDGLRAVGITHFGANSYGHGTGTPGGLYPTAYPLLDAFADTNMIIDLTHAADTAFWQILDYWEGPVHASHCNCRALVPGQRHLSDEMIKALCERGGVMGMVFAESMLSPQWDWDDPSTHYTKATRPMKAVVEHVDHICQLTGNTDHVAIGTDLDGGFGREIAPIDMDTVNDLQKFLNILRDRGYSEEDVEKIAHGNLLQLFRNAWSK